MSNATRRHALFICSEIGDSTSGLPIDSKRPTVVNTDAGKMSSTTGTFGMLNFGVPVRLSADAGMSRHWGAQAFRTEDAENDEFPTTANPPVPREGLSNDYSMLGLRALRKGEAKSTVNGVICMAYNDDELAAARKFYARFANAVLARLPIKYFEQISWQILPKTKWVYCVVTSDSAFHPPSFTSPILQTYLDDVCAEFMAYGEDFCQEFLKSTRSWSTYWLDNRIDDLCAALDSADQDTETECTDVILKKFAPCYEERCSVSEYCLKDVKGSGKEKVVKKESVFTGKIEQSKTKFFCLGMGSLINTPSRVGSGGKVTQCAIPVNITSQYPFSACWNFQNTMGGSQLTAGGMILRTDPRNNKPKAKTAAVVYPGPTDEEKMREQDEREVGYSRYNIPLEYIKSTNWCEIPEGITVFQYIPNTELPDADGSPPKNPAPFPTREYPLPQTYVDVCITGCLEYSVEFAATWLAGFVGWPEKDRPYWLNDRPMPRTPWIEQPRYREVDEILMSEIPKSFKCRSLPAEYAQLYVENKNQPLVVEYGSYEEASRKPAKAKNQVPKYFIFEYDDRIGFKQWEKVITEADIEQGIACRLLQSSGYRRSFCHHVEASNKFTAPSLRNDTGSGRDVNGVLYAAPNGWLKDGKVPGEKDDSFIGENMIRIELSAKDIHVLPSFMSIPPDVKIFTYATAKPQDPTYDFPIRQTLVDTILAGCMEHSVAEDFTAEWVDTTDGWKSKDGKCYWLNDRVIARRPWVALGGSYKTFDRLVYTSQSECVPKGVLLERRLPVEFNVNLA